jgi:hypothetical protein
MYKRLIFISRNEMLSENNWNGGMEVAIRSQKKCHKDQIFVDFGRSQHDTLKTVIARLTWKVQQFSVLLENLPGTVSFYRGEEGSPKRLEGVLSVLCTDLSE